MEGGQNKRPRTMSAAQYRQLKWVQQNPDQYFKFLDARDERTAQAVQARRAVQARLDAQKLLPPGGPGYGSPF